MLVNKTLLSPVREIIKCPKALPSSGSRVLGILCLCRDLGFWAEGFGALVFRV